MKHTRIMIYATVLAILVTSAIFIVFFRPESLAGDTRYEPVLTGSMEPSIPVGAVIAIKPVIPDSIKVGDVICFRFSESTLITHRVTSISAAGFITKGDANQDADIKIVTGESVVGKVVLVIPLIGYLGNFARTQLGMILLLFIPATTVIIYEIRNIINEIEPEKSILLKEEIDLIEEAFHTRYDQA